ncbi:MAG: crotonobetainyl-CoA:carnitine CoA-transferase CaiB-like acyl-CoA transferase [Candidatus Poriferisodalaceae bacterium]|jgi:crotonobetainyl-CoA:carnitine CoA-transferase CaiB-like acyl-CoA transferase
MTRLAPLAGLRVLETATGIAGPFAGRLLAMYGATVVKVEPDNGDPARRQPVDDEPLPHGTVSPLYVHLNAGKRNISSSNASSLGAGWADLVISSDVLSDLEGTAFSPSSLAGTRTKLITVTAWGAGASEPGVIADELLVQAATGFLGFNRDPDAGPLRLPGWQSQYAAGGLAALAGLSATRLEARHIDVSWLGSLLTCTELCYGDALHCQRPRTPVGAHPPTAFPSGALPCKDGHVTPGSLRPVDWEMQCLFYGIPEWIDDPEYAHRHNRPARIKEIWERIAPWYGARTKREIFQNALDSPWACGMVMTPLDALVDEHLVHRGFMGEVALEDGSTALAPLAPVHMSGLPIPDQRVEALGETTANQVSGPTVADGADRAIALQPLSDIRVLEMTIAWAGPYVGNILGPLGAQIIKIEAQSPFDGFRAQRPYDHGMAPGQKHLKEDNRFFEAGGLFNAVNKGKRDCVVSLTSDEGRNAFLALVANCDALIANFSAHVLPDLGLDWDTLKAANPRLVVVRAPAFGCEGPYSGATGYGSIVEAMSGLGQRQGYEHEAARISNIYFPDPIAGIHIANAMMAGLDHSDRTGEGVEIDLSHQEGTWLHSGEGLVLAATQNRDIGRMGNREPGVALAEFWPVAGAWLAVVSKAGQVADVQAVQAAAEAADMTEAVQLVVAAGGKAEPTYDPWSAPGHPRVANRLDIVDHPVTGPMRHLSSPFTVDGVRPVPKGPAPLFDQHTDEVFSEIGGLSAERIAELRTSGAIGGELPAPAKIGLTFK